MKQIKKENMHIRESKTVTNHASHLIKLKTSYIVTNILLLGRCEGARKGSHNFLLVGVGKLLKEEKRDKER